VDEGRRTFVGLAAEAFVAVSLFKWLSVYVSGGGDFYFKAREYTLSDDAVVYEYHTAQPRISAGLTFWMLNR
jgi:hypothetical protein